MRRAALTAGAILIGVLALTAALAWTGDAVSRQKAEKVRGRNVPIGHVRPGTVPQGVGLPPGGMKAPTDSVDGAQEGAADAAAKETAVLDAGMEFNLFGAVGTRAGGARGEEPTVVVRTSADGTEWSEWMTLTLEPVGGDVSGRRLVSEPCWVGTGRYVQFVADGPVKDLELSFVNSLGEQSAADRVAAAVSGVVAAVGGLWGSDVADAVTSKPTIVTRSQWGADESLRRSNPGYAPVKMAFVHHTVTGNSYSRSQAPALVRGMYYYHVKGAGFNDIGYNFLIDRYGTIYEGRYGGVTKGVVGAQTYGFNTNSTGVALIGTFSSTSPSSASLRSLKRLLAWKLDVHHVKPTSYASMLCRSSEKYTKGQTVRFRAISGHRNANYTSCPGGALYGKLPSVRTAAAAIGLPKIYSPRVTAAIFSPDGDGSADTTTLKWSASETLNWSLRITAEGGSVVRTFSGSGRSVAQTWDGRDADGAYVPDGSYTARVAGTSSRGKARAATISLIVDTEPPRVENFTVDPIEVGRTSSSRRQKVSIRYAVSEDVKTRVTIRKANGSWARTVSDWRWVSEGTRNVVWDGTVLFRNVYIPAPDGEYTVLVQARDRAGKRVASRIAVTCASDPDVWPNGATFCTKALRNFSIRRGSKAVFRFKVLYAPGAGETIPYSKALVTVKIRDANKRWRYTRKAYRSVNETSSYTAAHCWLPRGLYRYYIYAKLPDGRRAKLVGSARFRIY